MRRFISCLFLLTIVTPLAVRAEHEGKVQIVLLGDSTTEGSVPRRHVKEGPHLEDVVRQLLEAEGDLPPCNVINLGQSGDLIRRLLDNGRYDRQLAKLPGVDYIFIRYGINDQARRENFAENFMPDYHELIGRIRRDHASAKIVLMTIIPYLDETKSHLVNGLVRQVAEKEKLTLFDIYPRYAEELKKQGQNALNYRRFPSEGIPEKLRPFVKPFLHGDPPKVEVMDNRLDAHFGSLPGWYSDRHPNLAGYHVIGDETAKFLAPLLRERKAATPRR
ncbi:MAG TPA: SGNH/GDSL hydrolase family protein [Prosthecobacter sp.]|nr:SGNH/GDSL hydrolase family protein [Prosthecobacter sp.]